MNWLAGKNLGNFYPSFFCLLPNYNIQNRLKLHIQMKKNTVYTLSFFCLLFLGQLPAHAQNLLWAKQQGGTGDDSCNSIAVDNTGNVYSTGAFSGTADFDPGPGVFNLTSAGLDDIFISKLDTSGNLVWAKRIGGVGSDLGFSIAITPTGEVVLTGWFSSTADFDPGAAVVNITSAGDNDVFIAKFDTVGNYVWAKKIGSNNTDRGTSIATNLAGEIFLTGYFYNTVDFDPGTGVVNIASAGSSDVFVLKLSSSGNYIWAKTMGGTSNEAAYSIAINTFGEVFTTGEFHGPEACDFDPGIGVYSLSATNNEADIFILKLNASGNFVWAKKIGMDGNDAGKDLVVDSSGNVCITGYICYINDTQIDFDPGVAVYNVPTVGFYDTFVLKLDADGNFIWAKVLGGIGADFGQAIAVDAFGNIYTTGEIQGGGTIDFDPGIGVYDLETVGGGDIYVSKLDASGNFVWARCMGGFTNYEDGRSIKVMGNNLYVAGRFASTVDFDPDSAVFNMTPVGQNDSFICKLGGVLDTEEVPIPQLGINLFPNPCLDFFTLEMAGFQNSVAELYSLQGQLLQRILLVSVRTPIDVALLAKGPYILQIKNDSAVFTQKLLKQ